MQKSIDEIIASAEKMLEEKRLLKESRKIKKPPKISKPKGRPRLDQKRIQMAKDLAKTKPIPDVALIFGISKTTLYNYGITRKALNAEKLAEEDKLNCDSAEESAFRTVTD